MTETSTEATEATEATGMAPETTEPAPEAAEDPQAAETPEESEESEATSPNKEAAKYRRRLRETETERDTLRGRIEAMQRAEVERLTTDAGIKPAALWASGADLSALLTEEGTVDPAKVTEAVGTARDALGIVDQRVSRNHVRREGYTPNASPGNTWVDAFKGPLN